jgi:hypothetical protein
MECKRNEFKIQNLADLKPPQDGGAKKNTGVS